MCLLSFFLTQQLVACSPHANDDVWDAKELRRPLFPGPFAPGCCLLPSDFKGCHHRLPLLLSRLGMTTVLCIFTLLVIKERREPSSPHSELSRKKSHQDARRTHTWWAWLLSGLWLPLEKAHRGGFAAFSEFRHCIHRTWLSSRWCCPGNRICWKFYVCKTKLWSWLVSQITGLDSCQFEDPCFPDCCEPPA